MRKGNFQLVGFALGRNDVKDMSSVENAVRYDRFYHIFLVKLNVHFLKNLYAQIFLGYQ